MTNLDLVTQQMWAAMTSGLTAFQQQQTAGLTGAAALAAQAAESVYLATGGTQTTYRVKTDADLPTTGVSNGQTALVLTTGDLYLRDAGAWAKQSTLPTLARIQAKGLRTGELQTPDRRLRVPLISFQLDDAYVQDRTIAYPMFNARGMKASMCVITSYADDPAKATNFLRWDDIRWFQAQGWDVASHTVNHVRIDSLSAAQLHYECAESLRVMRSQGLNPTTLVYPQAYHSAESRAIVRQYYRAGIAGIEPTDQNSAPLRSFAVARRSISNTRTLAQYKADVDKCLAEGTWLVFIVHTGYDLDATQQGYLGELLDYIQTKQIRVCTVTEGLDVYGNLYEAGDTAGAQWTAVTAQGDLTSSNAAPQRNANTGASTVTGAAITAASPITAFEPGTRTVTVLGSNLTHNMPTTSGLLITDRSANQPLYPRYAWQEWRDYATSKRWLRKAKDNATWDAWEPMEAALIVSPLNAYAASVGPDGYPQKRITRFSVNSAGNAGYPTSAGTLETDTTVDIGVGSRFTRQVWTDYATGQISFRAATSATAWEATWTALSTGGGTAPAPAVNTVTVVSAINAYTNASAPNAFPAGKISHSAVTASSAAGFPTTAGLLETDATTAIGAGAAFTRQRWTDYTTGQIFTRTAATATTWNAWVLANQAPMLAANTVTGALAYDQYPEGVVSYGTRTSGGVAAGLPTDSGTLKTDRTNYAPDTSYAVYVHQEWRDKATGKEWHRSSTGAGWTAWLAVTYGIGTIRYAISHDLPPIAAGTQVTQDFPYTGVTLTDTVTVNAAGIEAGLVLRAEIPVANTLRLVVFNATAAAVDPASRAFVFRVTQ